MVDWSEFGEPRAAAGLFALLTAGLPPATVGSWTVDMPDAVRYILGRAVEAASGPQGISFEALGNHSASYREVGLDGFRRDLRRLAGLGDLWCVSLSV